MKSFFDLAKYAHTGIASPGMTAYDKARARAMSGGYPVRTIEGVPPISFKSDGKPLSALTLWGNARQTGTPSPDNIIMPELVGVRTANLFDYAAVTHGKYIDASGNEVDSSGVGEDTLNHSAFMPIVADQPYTLVVGKLSNYISNNNAFCWFDSTKSLIYRDVFNAIAQEDTIHATYTAPNNAAYLVINYRGLHGDTAMLNLGITALFYEPFGYKIPISCGGETTPVHLGEVPTVRRIKKLVLTGEENWGRYSANTFYLSEAPTNIIQQAPICSHFVGSASLETNDQITIPSTLRMRIRSDIAGDDVIAFKTWLANEYAAGHPVCVWYVLATPETGIANEPLCKIGDYADELHSTDAGIIIQTAKGDNVLTVDTDLQPSKVSITGHIKE